MEKSLIFDSIFFEKKAPSNRQLKVSQAIKNELSLMLISGELFYPGLDNTQLSVAHVKVTPDLRLATVYIAAHDDTKSGYYLEILHKLIPTMRKSIGASIRLKYTPEIRLRAVSYVESVFEHS